MLLLVALLVLSLYLVSCTLSFPFFLRLGSSFSWSPTHTHNHGRTNTIDFRTSTPYTGAVCRWHQTRHTLTLLPCIFYSLILTHSHTTSSWDDGHDSMMNFFFFWCLPHSIPTSHVHCTYLWRFPGTYFSQLLQDSPCNNIMGQIIEINVISTTGTWSWMTRKAALPDESIANRSLHIRPLNHHCPWSSSREHWGPLLYFFCRVYLCAGLSFLSTRVVCLWSWPRTIPTTYVYVAAAAICGYYFSQVMCTIIHSPPS